MTTLCPECHEPMSEDEICYDCYWFFKIKEVTVTDLLCPECREPMSEDGTCEDCNCFYEKQEFIVTDLYNYNARPQRS